jgi:hypothetical protein
VIFLENLLPIRKARAKFLGRYFNYLTVTPYIDWETFPGVFLHDFFDGGPERHFSAFFQRQFKNICGRLFHLPSYHAINSS